MIKCLMSWNLTRGFNAYELEFINKKRRYHFDERVLLEEKGKDACLLNQYSGKLQTLAIEFSCRNLKAMIAGAGTEGATAC